MLFDRPPRGHSSPATVIQRPGAGWTALVVVVGTAAATGVLLLSVTTTLPSPVTGGLSGLVGAVTAMGVGHRWYAIGPGWIRRGHAFVNLATLTAIQNDGNAVVLLDARQNGGWWARWFKPGRVRLPMQQLHAHPELDAALRSAVQLAVRGKDVLVTPRAATEFALNTHTSC